jgi:hypothetical protein
MTIYRTKGVCMTTIDYGAIRATREPSSIFVDLGPPGECHGYE